jgi:hypothetical protein
MRNGPPGSFHWVPAGIKPVLRPGPSLRDNWILLFMESMPNYMQPEHQISYRGFRIFAITDRSAGDGEWKSDGILVCVSSTSCPIRKFFVQETFKSEREAVYASFDAGKRIVDQQNPGDSG